MNRYYQNRLFADRQTSFSQRSLGKSVYCYSLKFSRLAQIFRAPWLKTGFACAKTPSPEV